MNHLRGFFVGLSVSVAFVVGCVASSHVMPDANAQQEAVNNTQGVECRVMRLDTVRARRIPAGWRPVGGTTVADDDRVTVDDIERTGPYPAVVLCRR